MIGVEACTGAFWLITRAARNWGSYVSLPLDFTPVVRRLRPKFFYLTQAETNPPTFVFFVNDADRIQTPYARYVVKSLRRLFRIEHAPMRVRFRSSHKKKGE